METVYYFYLINESFKALENEKHLGIVLNFLEKTKNSEFFRQQFSLIVQKLDVTKICEQLKLRFKDRKDFTIEEDNSFYLYSDISETYEKLIIHNQHIILQHSSQKSVFYDFLALYHPDLVAVNDNFTKIIPLRLVKPLNIG